MWSGSRGGGSGKGSGDGVGLVLLTTPILIYVGGGRFDLSVVAVAALCCRVIVTRDYIATATEHLQKHAPPHPTHTYTPAAEIRG